MMPRLRILRAFAVVAFVAACNALNPTDTCACSRVPPHTLVYGRVTDPAGAAVPAATVRVEAGPASCQAFGLTGEVQTDAAGTYRIGVTGDNPNLDQCVRLSARPPAGSALRSSDTLQFTIAAVRLPPDSVRRDVALRAP